MSIKNKAEQNNMLYPFKNVYLAIKVIGDNTYHHFMKDNESLTTSVKQKTILSKNFNF